MKTKRILWIAVLLLALSLAACAPVAQAPTPTATAQPMTFTDGLGRSVSLPAPAERIVSLAPSNTEILYAVGAGDQVVGRDDFTNYPAEATDLPSIGGSMSDYDLEQIVNLKPDLVLAAEINTPEQVKSMEDLGLTVFYLKNPTDLDGMYANLELVGQLVGKEDQATALVDSLKARVQAVEDKVATDGSQPGVFYELDGSTPASPWTSGPGTFMDLLIRMAGGTNAAAGIGTDWGQMSQEALLVADPDYILLGDAKYGTTPEDVAARPGWDALSAVKDGNVFAFDDDLASRPGPRLVDGLEQLAQLIHPELSK